MHNVNYLGLKVQPARAVTEVSSDGSLQRRNPPRASINSTAILSLTSRIFETQCGPFVIAFGACGMDRSSVAKLSTVWEVVV